MRRFYSIAALLVLLGGLVVLGRAVLFEGRVLSGPDLVNYFLPTTHFARGWLLEGTLPLWNPMTFCGWPLVGDAQLRWFYPPNLLLLVLDPARAFSLLVLAYIGFAALGMWVYLRRAGGVGPWPAACGAASFALGGFFANHLMSGIVVFPATAAWVPWILLLGWRLGNGETTPRTLALFAAAIAAQILSGAPQIVFYTWIVVLLQGLWRAGSVLLHTKDDSSGRAAGPRPAMRILAAYAVAGTLGIAAGASSLLPVSEFGALSFQRGEKPGWEAAADCSVAPRYLWLMAAPRFFGDPHNEALYWGGQEGYWDICAYMGIGPVAALLLVLLSAPRLFRSRQAENGRAAERQERVTGFAAFHLVLAVLALALALGRWNPIPIYRLLYEWVPGFDRFRVPGRWLLFWEFGLAVILALVLERLIAARDDTDAVPKWALLGPLGLALVLGVCSRWSPAVMEAAGISRFVPGFNPSGAGAMNAQRIAWTSASLLRGAGFACGWLVVFALAMRLRLPAARYVAPLALALALADVLTYGPEIATTRTPEGQRDEFYPRSPLIRFLSANLHGHRELALDDVHSWLTDQNQPELWANRATIHDVRDARGYYPLCLRSFGRFFNLLHNRPPDYPLGGLLQPVMPTTGPATLDPGLLAMLDVRFLLTYSDLQLAPLRLLERTSFGLRIYEVTNRYGPAWLAESRSTERMSGDEEAALLAAGGFDPRTEALASRAPPAGWEIRATDKPGSISLTRPSPTRIEVRVDRGAGDLLVVSEAYHPGWRATIDDEPTPLVRANHAFLGAYVPPGPHTVGFAFQPTSFRVGFYVTCAAWLILAALVVAAVGRRRTASE